jgi:diacylglycerol kinase family enzyme
MTGVSGEERRAHLLMLTISNGRFFGGGFPIAPDAAIDDGLLHACWIGDAPPLTRLRLFNLAERGRHVSSDRVEVLPESGFRLLFQEPPRFEMDGDVRRARDRTVDVRVLPAALRVLAPSP